MDDLVNKLEQVERQITGSGIKLRLRGDQLIVSAPPYSASGQTALSVVRLNRPSSLDVQKAASPEAFLVLDHCSAKAAATAAAYNHVIVPEGSFRIITRGVALIHDSSPVKNKINEPKRAQLRGLTGVVAESLLIEGPKPWTIETLAQVSGVSKGLAHRVLARLEDDGWMEAQGSGPNKTRTLHNPAALAETWSQEEKAPEVVLKGYLFGSSPEAVAQKALQICPEGAIGGVLAANAYKPTLTRAPYPVRLWVPGRIWIDKFKQSEMQETGEGANIEIVWQRNSPWQQHRDTHLSPKVSPWRAWIEVSNASGRTRELADALFGNLITSFNQNLT
jgi:hypothetical protein